MVLKYSIPLIAMFVLLLVYACPSIALEAQPESIAPSQEKNIPSLSELGTLYVKLTNFVEKSNSRLKLLVDIEEIDSKIEEMRAKVDEMRQKVAALGTPEDWYIDRLTHFKYQFDVARKSLEDIQGELAARLEEVEKIKERQRAEKKFWAVWAESLNQQGDKTLEKTFGQVTAQLATLAASVQKTSAVLVPRQEQVSMVEQGVIEELDRFSRELDRLRTATFRKNDFSFFSSKYYSQFSPSLWEELRAGVRSALVFDIEALEQRGWTSLLFLLLVFLLVAGIHKYRARFSKTEEWHFVLNHPWATGSFVASVLVATLSPATSPLFNLILTIIGVVDGY